jgi:hypothetical protein
MPMRHAHVLVLLTLVAVDFVSLFPSRAHGAEKKELYYHVTSERDMTEVSKRAAMLVLLQDPDATVVKCVTQEVSDKATLRNKKGAK